MIKFTCNNCGTSYEYEDSILEYERVSSDERQMGTENVAYFTQKIVSDGGIAEEN